MFNPYRMVARQVRALLQIEALLPPEEKRRCQWQLRVAFGDTAVIVGKGDVNTCFVMLGDSGNRKIGYPHHILDQLDKLARQPYPIYIVDVNGKRGRFFSREAALNVTPRFGGVIRGVDCTGAEHTAYRARENAIGAVKWLPTLNGDEDVSAKTVRRVRPSGHHKRSNHDRAHRQK